METVEIRQARLEDALAIAKIHVETWRCAYRGHMPIELLKNLSVEKRTEMWQENLKNPEPGVLTFVGEIANKIVGFASVGPCRDQDLPENTGELWAIYVSPDFMGKGVGSALLQKSLDYLKTLGSKQAILWVLSSNEKTRKWYEAKGWQPDGKTKIETMDNIETHDSRYIISL